MAFEDQIGLRSTIHLEGRHPITHSVQKIPYTTRKKLRRIVQRSPDREFARRAQAILLLNQLQGCVSRVAELTQAARSSFSVARPVE